MRRGWLSRLATGSTFKAVTKSDLQRLDIPTPSLDEQQKIANVLYNVDQAIQKSKEIIKVLERIHEGLLRKLIPQGIDHDQYREIRILGRTEEIPDTWSVTTVSEACETIIDYRGKNPEFAEDGIPHLRNINIQRGRIVLDELKYVSEETYDDWMTRGFPQKGDTLLSTEAPMGETALLPELKFSLSQRLIVLRPREKFDKSFFSHLMGSPFVQKEYKARATGSTVKGISNYNLQKILIPVPPKDEQKEIAQITDKVLNAIQRNEEQVQKSQRLKQGLMQDLLSGTVRTTDANIEILPEVEQHG